MSYPKIDEIPRSERTYWSPERGGRKWQWIGGHKVPKFSYSPFTAKPSVEYTFYADVEIKTPVEYAGKSVKFVTVIVYTGTYLGFRDFVLSGEAMERVREVVRVYGVEEIVNVTYWRNRGAKAKTEVSPESVTEEEPDMNGDDDEA